MSVGNNTIFATSLVEANGGTPPSKLTMFAITGGTGKYAGVRGQMALKPLSDSRYKISFTFVN
jgi:hypothetical protein